MYNAKKTAKFQKKTYNKLNWETNNEGYKVCPNGNIFNEVLKVEDNTKNDKYPRFDVVFGCQGCNNCLNKDKCTKTEQGRTIVENSLLNIFHEIAEENLNTETGIDLRIRRSIETEGAFGILKNNWDYERIRRRGIEKVEMELLLTAIGFNLRKYHMKKQRNKAGIILN